MKYFNRSEDEILFALIKKDNPSLVPELTTQNCYITTPHPNTGADADRYNTVATVRPRHGSGLYGPIQIKYNRVDLKDLFKGQIPVIASGFSAADTYATREEMPRILGTCYGLPINKGDVDDTSSANFYIEGQAGHGTEIFKIANNKCFIGQVTIKFRRDKLENIAELVSPPVLNGMKAEKNTQRGLGDPRLPAPWAYFGDFDFTEIMANVDHQSNFSRANVEAIAAFTGMALSYDSTTTFDPACPYKCLDHFGKHFKALADNQVSRQLTDFPWLNKRFTHAKVCVGVKDPISNAAIPAEKQPVFVFYYNKYEN